MSTLTMSSRRSSAAARRSEFGVLAAGLPAKVSSARTCPSPGVSISSARHATGSSPNTSPSPRTRLCQRPKAAPRPRPGAPAVFDDPVAVRGNIAPPGRSRLPVRTLRTSTSQLAIVPKRCVVVPMRP
jgi:hypothetical protein